MAKRLVWFVKSINNFRPKNNLQFEMEPEMKLGEGQFQLCLFYFYPFYQSLSRKSPF